MPAGADKARRPEWAMDRLLSPPLKEAKMTTSLAFRTPVGGISVPAGQSKALGVVDVSKFSQIRVVADERVGSGTGISIRLTMTEGNELVAQLDILSLLPHSQVK